jgi:hypothetical protein
VVSTLTHLAVVVDAANNRCQLWKQTTTVQHVCSKCERCHMRMSVCPCVCCDVCAYPIAIAVTTAAALNPAANTIAERGLLDGDGDGDDVPVVVGDGEAWADCDGVQLIVGDGEHDMLGVGVPDASCQWITKNDATLAVARTCMQLVALSSIATTGSCCLCDFQCT